MVCLATGILCHSAQWDKEFNLWVRYFDIKQKKSSIAVCCSGNEGSPNGLFSCFLIGR